ncbi:MAG TPA: hypothetical protein DHW07_02280 [Gammaproteobacteria bacterium]|nr:hypothetical protein [Gammaproteobacteria bacterium]|tara:strand:+ start:221 stop:730 length:510 start_codon:yes stop_codon:yes gene_type:complete
MSYQVKISVLDDFALLNLRGTKAAVARFETALELEFPKGAQGVRVRDGVAVLNLAPDHWWVRTSLEDEDQTFTSLSEAITIEHAAITVVSDHFSGFSIVGDDALLVLRQGLSLDLRNIATGQCTRGSFARCGGTLQVLDQGYHYDLFVEASYADYVSAWLDRAGGGGGA